MTRRDAAFLLLLGALWGAVFPLAAAVLHHLQPLAVVVARSALSTAVLVPVAARRGNLLANARRRPVALLTATLLQLTVPIVLLTAGQKYVSAGLASILLATQPVWAAIIAFAARRHVSAASALGVALGMAGVVLLFMKDLGGSSTAPVGGILLVAAAAGYAGGAAYIQAALPEVPPLTVAAAATTLTTVLLAPSIVFTPVVYPGFAALGALLMLGTIATGGALVLFYRLVKGIGSVRANVAAYLAPGFAVVYDIPLGHRPPLTALIGLALIVAGSAATASQSGKSPETERP